MLLAMRMAIRYLWSRKSHSAVTAISIAGVCGVCIATMAIVCVLSVFNGFNDVIKSRDSRILSDFTVEAVDGKLLANADSLADIVSVLPCVESVTPVINDEAVAFFEGRQLPVRILGVYPDKYRKVTAVDSIIVSGRWSPQPQDIVDIQAAQEITPADMTEIEEIASEDFDEAELFETDPVSEPLIEPDTLPASPVLVSVGVASNLKIPSTMECGLMLFLPRRTSSAAFSNPSTAFMVDSLAVTGIFSSEQPEFDAATVIMDIDVARRLLEYDTQANSLYIKTKNGIVPADADRTLTQALGVGYKVSDKDRQQTLHFRMVAIEKWITFLLLSFILLIASFNIISTLSMLIVEKRDNIRTMRDYGASRSLIGRIFFWESIIVCMSGSLAGIVLGVVLCLCQICFGFITMPADSGQMIITSYPVSIHLSDLLLVFAMSAAVALFIALVSAAYARRVAKLNKIN